MTISSDHELKGCSFLGRLSLDTSLQKPRRMHVHDAKNREDSKEKYRVADGEGVEKIGKGRARDLREMREKLQKRSTSCELQVYFKTSFTLVSANH